MLGAKWAKGARPLFQPVSGDDGVRPLFGNGIFISCGGQSLPPGLWQEKRETPYIVVEKNDTENCSLFKK